MTINETGTTTTKVEGSAEAPTTEGGGSGSAPMAMTSDGRLLLNIEECAGCDLKGRAMFVGVFLNDDEMDEAARSLENAAHGLAGHIGGKLIKKKSSGGES